MLKSKDYYFNADVNPLYPAAMNGVDFFSKENLQCDGYFPIGFGKFSDTQEQEFKAGKMGFYEIAYKPPQHLRDPVLPYKHDNGIFWTNEGNQGIYTSVDVENAIFAGYQITFKNKCYVYEKKAKIFKKYLTRLLELKEQYTIEKNEAKRQIIKILLNSLYGKLLQRADKNNEIINNFKEYCTFATNNNILSLKKIGEERYLIQGETKEYLRETKNNKPIQLGAFVLAYS